MTTPKRARARTESAHELYRAEVAAYVAAGGDETVQRVITGVHGLARRLNQWYDRQLADATNVAASSMTHRLDRMSQRGLVARATDPDNRTRILVTLTEGGWETFRAATQESNMVETDVLGRLTTDQRQDLASLLEIVIAGLDEEAPA